MHERVQSRRTFEPIIKRNKGDEKSGVLSVEFFGGYRAFKPGFYAVLGQISALNELRIDAARFRKVSQQATEKPPHNPELDEARGSDRRESTWKLRQCLCHQQGAVRSVCALFSSQNGSSEALKTERKPIQQPSVRVGGIVQPRAPKICNGVLHRFQRRKALIGFKVGLVQEWAKLNSPAAWDDHTPGSDALAEIWKPFPGHALLTKPSLWMAQATAGSVPAACAIQR